MSDHLLTLQQLFIGLRIRWSNEDDLQRGVEQVLTASSVSFKREHSLGKLGRLDFFVPLPAERTLTLFDDLPPSGLGYAIEVKCAGSSAPLIRQLHRYMGEPTLLGALVVTPLRRLRVPAMLLDKPIKMARLG